ncbi:amino acid ABC transporter permease [Mycetocola reblochoni]|uniref:ABC-type amino acid transport system, permease component n=2 Tax=Mycetocola reblochoni TaxID=331618 RepID=A0A1R4IE32_9MICO|nr:amino acid ABC transporter permease [Mycetocola reblochoni]RLP68138.1 amino acid ABC transporter permease [Mycetocola reblochoni]SJN18016.1 ABC-type amino acid transport system, permease component [Mycetocola reblochoni REB411]
MDTLIDNSDVFIAGFRTTIYLFLISAVGALVLGVVIGAMRVAPVKAANVFGTVYVNTVRNTPLTLLMFFFAFGYDKLGLIDLSYFTLAAVALSMYTASYVAETIRSGINTVPVGQAEAARAIGLPFTQTLGLIVLPQAFRAVVPPMVSVFVALLKNTTIAAGFSVAEAGAIRATLSERGEPQLVVLLWVAAIFVALVMILSLVQNRLEKKWAVSR